jgi:hypothetical protein
MVLEVWNCVWRVSVHLSTWCADEAANAKGQWSRSEAKKCPAHMWTQLLDCPRMHLTQLINALIIRLIK